MDSLLKLAKVFDGQPSATYAANIMTFIPTSGKYPWFEEEVWSKVRFGSTDRSEMAGVLALRSGLSRRSTALGKEEPDDIAPFCLPIPKKTLEGNRSTLLPGAPRVFALKKSADGYADTSALGEW